MVRTDSSQTKAAGQQTPFSWRRKAGQAITATVAAMAYVWGRSVTTTRPSKRRFSTATLQTEGYENSVVSMYHSPFLYNKHKTNFVYVLVANELASKCYIVIADLWQSHILTYIIIAPPDGIWRLKYICVRLSVYNQHILRTAHQIYFTLGKCVTEEPMKCSVKFAAIWTSSLLIHFQ